ncbi:uncharacterized protein LOC143301070 [Babylonia areolata]|uniref:uncharacterized protein LOC143301070 n=1 Tax=Babylonia areolata TaxID=304850 RepID=UPI003FD24E65
MKTLAFLTVLVLACMMVTDTEAGWRRFRWRRVAPYVRTGVTVWSAVGKRSADGCPFDKDFTDTGNALLVKFNLQCPQHGLVAKDAVLAAYDASNKDGIATLDECELGLFPEDHRLCGILGNGWWYSMVMVSQCVVQLLGCFSVDSDQDIDVYLSD